MTTNHPIPPFSVKEYDVVSVIGQGAFSTVYLAIRMKDGQKLAIKVIEKSSLNQPGDIVRLQRELDATAFIRHENVVALRDFFEEHGFYYLVMDYCQGGDLLEYIVKSKRLREPQAAIIFLQLLQGVQYCHAKGIAHRDLKPANVLIDVFPYIKISDFGLCGYISNEKKMGTFCGSPSYASPESLSQMEYDGQKSDIWSLGVILFEMVTGTHPWNIKNTAAMVKQIKKAQFSIPDYVSAPCAELISSILKISPNDRPTIALLLTHPWLRLAGARRRQSLSMTESSLPPLVQVQERRGSDTEPTSVVSPFMEKEKAKQVLKPATIWRSGSDYKFDMKLIVPEVQGRTPKKQISPRISKQIAEITSPSPLLG